MQLSQGAPRLQLGELKQSPSVASISTRVSSSASLSELASGSAGAVAVELRRESLLQVLGKALRKHRRALLQLAVASVALLFWQRLWQRRVLRAARSTNPWGSQAAATFMTSVLAFFARRIFKLRTGASDFDERPERVPQPEEPALVCIHPHGTNSMGNMAHLMFQMRGNPEGSLQNLHVVAADAVFQLPGYGELMVLNNVRVASKRTVDSLLAAGKQVALAPGGIHEQLRTDPQREQLFFPPNLGFVRAAIRHGVPLVPMYNFGENQLFNVPKWSRAVSDWMKRNTGAGLPVAVGRHNLPFLPLPVPVETRFGRPVPTGPADADPSDAKVVRIFREYCRELHRLFDGGKAALPADVASKGLRLIWRKHEAVDLSAEALADDAAACSERSQATVRVPSRL